jgi:hypothetical protein
LIGSRRDPAEHESLDPHGIGRAKKRAGVIEAADVVERDDDGQ